MLEMLVKFLQRIQKSKNYTNLFSVNSLRPPPPSTQSDRRSEQDSFDYPDRDSDEDTSAGADDEDTSTKRKSDDLCQSDDDMSDDDDSGRAQGYCKRTGQKLPNLNCFCLCTKIKFCFCLLCLIFEPQGVYCRSQRLRLILLWRIYAGAGIFSHNFFNI